mgnify:CR=1 FL=1
MGQRFLIYGLTTEGKKFRPSDWAERFCGVLSPYDNEVCKKSKKSVLVLANIKLNKPNATIATNPSRIKSN